MKYKIFALLLGMAATAGLALSASAAQTHEVPVTLTVVNTQQRISVTGCPTRGAGTLTITEEAFPAIEAGEALTIQYQARVEDSGEVSAVQAATLVFTIAAAE